MDYAEDTVICSECVEQVEENLQQWRKCAKEKRNECWLQQEGMCVFMKGKQLE